MDAPSHWRPPGSGAGGKDRSEFFTGGLFLRWSPLLSTPPALAFLAVVIPPPLCLFQAKPAGRPSLITTTFAARALGSHAVHFGCQASIGVTKVRCHVPCWLSIASVGRCGMMMFFRSRQIFRCGAFSGENLRAIVIIYKDFSI